MVSMISAHEREVKFPFSLPSCQLLLPLYGTVFKISLRARARLRLVSTWEVLILRSRRRLSSRYCSTTLLTIGCDM